jgi:hypothetical protein
LPPPDVLWGIPGIGLLIEGAMQQAAQPGRHAAGGFSWSGLELAGAMDSAVMSVAGLCVTGPGRAHPPAIGGNYATVRQ